MHYTQQPSRVTSQTNTAATILHARMQGYITGPMLLEELAGWDTNYGERLPTTFLLDLHDVSGYGPGTPSIARRWLLGAEARGVQRIAFLARSSVIRTIVTVISPDVNVHLRCFVNESDSVAWLEGRTPQDKGASKRRRAAGKRPSARARP